MYDIHVLVSCAWGYIHLIRQTDEKADNEQVCTFTFMYYMVVILEAEVSLSSLGDFTNMEILIPKDFHFHQVTILLGHGIT